MLLQISFVSVYASSDYLVIENIDFDNDIELTFSGDGERLEKLKGGFGYSYILNCTETGSALVQLERKKTAFNDGKLILELDFMCSDLAATYYLVHLRSISADETVNHNRDCYVKNGKCGDVEIKAGQWYHLKYELDVDNKKSAFYIGGNFAGSNDSVILDGDFSAWRVSIEDAECELAIDNIKVSKQTSLASVESVNYYTANETEMATNAVSSELFFAEVYFDRAVDFNSVNEDNVDVYQDGEQIFEGYNILPDIDNPKRLTVYFDDFFQSGSRYSIDFSNLIDEWGLTLMENSKIEFEIDSSTYSNAVYKIINYDGEEIADVDEISNGDKIRLSLDFVNKYEDAWKPCIFVFAIYDENGRMKDVVTEEVTVNPYTPDVSITTDFITVEKEPDEKLFYKGYLWEKDTLSPKIEKFLLERKEMQNVGTLSPDFSGLTEFVEDEIINPSSYFSGYDDVKEQFADKVCFVVDSSHIYGGGKKYTIDERPVYKNGQMWIPAALMQEIFGRSFSSSKTFDGTKYVSLKGAAEEMSLYSGESYKGLGVISAEPVNIEISTKLADVKRLIRYITFDRPSKESLKKAMEGISNPRALATSKVLADMQNSTDKKMQEFSNAILRKADALLAEETPIDTPNNCAPVGGEYDSIMELYWIYKLTGDRQYADKAIEHAVRMSNWEHWLCNGFLSTSYDLLTCGYVYDLFKNEMTTEQKEIIQKGIYEKGILPAREHYYGRGESNWPLRLTNWNVVCNAGVIVAALAICNDYESDVCFDVLEKALVSLEYAMLECAPDGGWFEGVGYSGYTMNYLTLALQALQTAFGTVFSLADAPGFLKYGYFTYYMTATEDKVNLHDEVRGRNGLSSTSSLWIANYTGDTVLQNMRMNWITNIRGGESSFLDMLWYTPGDGSLHIDAPLDRNFSFAEMATSRSGWEGDATFLSVHAGDNGCSHGQMDIGQFELEVDGTRFALDMGRDDYSLPNYFYFGSTREEYYVNRAEGHNVYVINPDEAPGQYYYAMSEVETVAEKPDGVIYTIDMTPAYIGQVKKAKRGYMLTDNRKVFVMQDEITPRKSGDEYYWFWHTDAEITIDKNDNSHVTLTKNGIDLDLYFKSNVDFTVTSGESLPLPTSPEGEGEQLKTYGTVNKITARFTSGTDDISFRVVAVPEGISYDAEMAISPVSGWTVADGIRSDRYTITDGEIFGVWEGTETEEFLSHVYTGSWTKDIYANGLPFSGKTLPKEFVLEVGDNGTIYEYAVTCDTPSYTTVCEPAINSFSGTIYGTTTSKQYVGDTSVYFGTDANGEKIWIKGEASDETGGNAIHLESTADTVADTIQLFRDFKTNVSSGRVKVSIDYKADNMDASLSVDSRFDNLPRGLINFNKDGTITAFGKKISEYSAGKWINVEVIVTPGITNLYRVNIDGELVTIGSAEWLRYSTPMTQLKLTAETTNGKAASLWFDNFKAETVSK